MKIRIKEFISEQRSISDADITDPGELQKKLVTIDSAIRALKEYPQPRNEQKIQHYLNQLNELQISFSSRIKPERTSSNGISPIKDNIALINSPSPNEKDLEKAIKKTEKIANKLNTSDDAKRLLPFLENQKKDLSEKLKSVQEQAAKAPAAQLPLPSSPRAEERSPKLSLPQIDPLKIDPPENNRQPKEIFRASKKTPVTKPEIRARPNNSVTVYKNPSAPEDPFKKAANDSWNSHSWYFSKVYSWSAILLYRLLLTQIVYRLFRIFGSASQDPSMRVPQYLKDHTLLRAFLTGSCKIFAGFFAFFSWPLFKAFSSPQKGPPSEIELQQIVKRGKTKSPPS